ncbi:hypothetical protein [Marinifilum fragile]|uniref:hypothetical protein n=1 Tax=Marinifilum fragile TaxID=570161 RepID=UPI002AA62C50|nr:hypothetical protein [Marinifilum fragile]
MFTYKETEQKQFTFEQFNSKLEKEYDYLLKYFELNSSRIESTINELRNSLDEEIEADSSNEVLINEFYESQLLSIVSFYYHSSITLVHSFIENQLLKLCKEIQDKTMSKFDVSLMGGRDYIKSSLDYLKLTTRLDDEILNRHKPRLKQFQILRNKIIHDNSSYFDDTEKRKLQNAFSDKIEYFEEEQKFYLKSDELPKEYLSKGIGLFREIFNYLRSLDFIVPTIESESAELPF